MPSSLIFEERRRKRYGVANHLVYGGDPRSSEKHMRC